MLSAALRAAATLKLLKYAQVSTVLALEETANRQTVAIITVRVMGCIAKRMVTDTHP